MVKRKPRRLLAAEGIWRIVWKATQPVPELWVVTHERPPVPKLGELIITPRPGADLKQAWARLMACSP